MAGRPPRARRRAGGSAQAGPGAHLGPGPAADGQAAPALGGAGLRRRARLPRGPARQRQRRHPAEGRLRGQPRPARGGGGDPGGDRAGAGGHPTRVVRSTSPGKYPGRMSQPDLFVVCKNCGSEVSPYVTECPYCGQRVRKRAPKIDRGAGEAPERKRRGPKLSRLRPDEIEGIAPDRRPYATMLIVLVSLAATLVIQAGVDPAGIGQITVGAEDDVWRWFAAPFVYDTLGYEVVTLVAVGIFGSLLERRYGPLATIAIFILSGAAGCALAVQLDVAPLFSNHFTTVIGANGAALGLLTAWVVDDRLAARRGEDRGNDMLGVAVFAGVLVLLSVAVEEANIAAAVGGAAVGALLGTVLPLFTRNRATY